MTALRVGVVNPLGLVGNEVKDILAEKRFHFGNITLLDAGPAGDEAKITEVGDAAALVVPINDDELEGLDIVFFCGSPRDCAPWIAKRHELGFTAIDLTQPSSLADEGIPVVAGVNFDSIGDATLLLSPHPIAVPVVLILDAVRRKWPVSKCVAAVIQPASEFGQTGVDELYKQTVNALNMQSIPKETFDRQVAFNLFPAVDATGLTATARNQIRAISGRNFDLALSVTQGTIFHGHSFSIFLELDGSASAAALTEALGAYPAIELAEEDEPIGTLDAAGRDHILIGRVETEPETPNGFWIWAAVDNLRRGSALNAVLIAEWLVETRGAKPN